MKNSPSLFIKIWVFALFLLFSVTPSGAQINNSNDCATAGSVCGSGTMNISPWGSGNDVDFTTGSGSNPSTNPAGFNSGCLLAGELNPNFIIITANSSGTIEWSVGQDNSFGCFDWIMWPYTPSTCSQIAAGTLPPVACCWNGFCEGYAGMANPLPPGGDPSNFQNPVMANPGDQFLLCISNYSGLTGSVPWTFLGTADISCGVTICPGSSINLTGPAGGVTYTWTPPTGLSSTNTQSTLATPTAPTQYNCHVDYGGGLFLDSMITINFFTPPAIAYSTTPETCAGDNDGTITMNPTGASPFSYTLNGVPQASGNFTGLGGGNYLVQVTDANGCVSDTLIAFPAGPNCCTLVLNTTSTQTTCPYNCDGTANVNIAGAMGVPTVVWMNGGVPIGQTNPTANGLCPGNYTVEVTDPGNCTLTANVSVTSAPGLTIASVTPNGTTCNGACDGQLTVNAPTAVQYSIDGGVTFQPSNIFNALCANTYQVIAENGNGCQDTMPATITQPAVLTVQLATNGLTDVSCFGAGNGSVDMDVSGGTAPYNYSWNTTPVQNVQDATGLPAGNWCLTVTDANGCLGNACVTVNEPTQLGITFAVVNPSCFQACDGSATVIPNGGTAPYSYNWNGLAGSSSTVAASLCNGVYNLTVTDANGCTADTLNFPVVQPAQVQVGVVSTVNETCYHSCDGQISINSPDGASFSIDGGSSFQVSPQFTSLCEGVYSIVVEDANGCSNTATATLVTPPEVIADFYATPQPTDIYMTEITFINTSVFGNVFAWTFDSLGSSTAVNPVFLFPNTGPGDYNVCLSATNAAGCQDTICHIVTINDILYYYVPNAFTPDGNGTNDIFYPVLNNVDEDNYNFYIFTRWGEMIYHSTNINDGWDGTYKGIKAKEDVYVWKITGKNKENAEKFQVYGHVSLLR